MDSEIITDKQPVVHYHETTEKIQPKITPRKLLGNRGLPINCNFAIVCYCPMPPKFVEYEIKVPPNDRYFIHTHNSHVMFCEFNNRKFIVVAEVYGGPVSVTTVEELHHYGIKTIIGLGFVGSLHPDHPIGSCIVADSTTLECGASLHYLIDNNTTSGGIFPEYLFPSIKLEIEDIPKVRIWTTNALYREYPDEIRSAQQKGCKVVNMDTSSLYAASGRLGVDCEYYAVVSDVLEDDESSYNTWNNALTDAVNNDTSSVIISQGNLIKLLLERLCSKF
ncbi:Phosphorylase [uncultured virus]|nr:Phosphorylase [uncultured virus]